jgi:hypothetical protein
MAKIRAAEAAPPPAAMAIPADPAMRGARRWLTLLLFASQLALALGWAVYFIYLPSLGARVGLDARDLLTLLLVDQLLFALADFALGRWGDRVLALLCRFTLPLIALVSLAAAAFLAMPLLTAHGAGAGTLLACAIVWVLASSVLRAPMFLLLARYAVQPQDQRWFTSGLLAIGLAGALSPFLALLLKGVDPLLPFGIASASLLLAALVFVVCERRLPLAAPSARPVPKLELGALFWCALLALALGIQIHTALNSPGLYVRQAVVVGLEWLLPWFWVGFGLMLAVLGFALPPLRHDRLMYVALPVAIVAVAAAPLVPSLWLLVLAQIAAGSAWGALFFAGTSMAALAGHFGREGRLLGNFFALLAMAAALRIGVVLAELVPHWLPRERLLAAPPLLLAVAAVLLALAARNWPSQWPKPMNPAPGR